LGRRPEAGAVTGGGFESAFEIAHMSGLLWLTTGRKERAKESGGHEGRRVLQFERAAACEGGALALDASVGDEPVNQCFVGASIGAQAIVERSTRGAGRVRDGLPPLPASPFSQRSMTSSAYCS